MKNLVLFSVVVMSFVACRNNSRFCLDGTILNANDGEMICLLYPIKRGNIWYKQCDTTYVDKGKFYFKGLVDDITPASLVFENMDEVELFIGPTDMTFSAERSTMYDYSIRGLCIDDEIDDYREYFAEHNREIYKRTFLLQRKNEEMMVAFNAGAKNANDIQVEFHQLLSEYKKKYEEWPKMAMEFIANNPNYFIVPHIIRTLVRLDYDGATIESLRDNLLQEQQQSVLGELMAIHGDIAKSYNGVVGSKALNFTLRSADNGVVSLSDRYAKGYVLLDFWASWCRSCISEIPTIKSLYDKLSDIMQILSISIDQDETQWHNAVAKHNLMQWTQLIADRANDVDKYYFVEQADISTAYGVDQIHCFILIDNSVNIICRWSHLTNDVIKEIEQIVSANN